MSKGKEDVEVCIVRFLTMRKHCWLKLWLMYVASIARLRGELKELPSSCGGSLAVSLTVSKSERSHYRC